jgi:hypothetical protein
MKREILHVIPQPDKTWGLKFHGRSRLYKQFANKSDAVLNALYYAWKNSVRMVCIHDYNGIVVKEVSFVNVK